MVRKQLQQEGIAVKRIELSRWHGYWTGGLHAIEQNAPLYRGRYLTLYGDGLWRIHHHRTLFAPLRGDGRGLKRHDFWHYPTALAIAP